MGDWASWATVLDIGRSIRTVFVDFQKAFNRVDHNTVLHKLAQHDVPHFIVKWMFSILTAQYNNMHMVCWYMTNRF